MEKEFDSNRYWKDRHLELAGSLSSVGQKSASELANHYTYLIVKEQYAKVLDRLALPKGTTVLDAGSGIGFFSKFLFERGYCVTAADISSKALEAIDNERIRKIAGSLDKLELGDKTFDVVHSFDVLYHIINDEAWKSAVGKLCQCARRYLILHQSFVIVKGLVRSKHIKVRTYREITTILGNHGFTEIMSTPTHVLAQRLLTYRLSALFPLQSYRLDRYLLDRMEDCKLSRPGSHHIKVFARAD